jgi:aminoglycoside phosphotransferase (APT) family kinase protein
VSEGHAAFVFENGEPRSIPAADDRVSRPTVDAAAIEALCTRLLGAEVDLASVTELVGGRYNTTYRLELAGRQPVVLRVAPPERYQLASERHLMRNEIASVPLLAPLVPVPQLLASDTSHTVINRDLVLQSWVPGVPAAEALAAGDEQIDLQQWRQLGTILRRIHRVEGEHFGRVAGPQHPTWSTHLGWVFETLAYDLKAGELDATAAMRCVEVVAQQSAVLDDIGPPRLLHGDLGPGNVIVASAKAADVIGLVDCDRTWWGDPMADWTMYLLERRRPAQQRAFWEGYGPRPREDHAVGSLRRSIYIARSSAEAALEHHRMGQHHRAVDAVNYLKAVVRGLTV